MIRRASWLVAGSSRQCLNTWQSLSRCCGGKCLTCPVSRLKSSRLSLETSPVLLARQSCPKDYLLNRLVAHLRSRPGSDRLFSVTLSSQTQTNGLHRFAKRKRATGSEDNRG